MNNWYIIIVLGGITFSMRILFFLRVLPINFGPHAQRFLSYSAPAVISALVMPILIMPSGSMALSVSNNYLIAGIVAFALGLMRVNALATILLSLVAFYLLSLIYTRIV